MKEFTIKAKDSVICSGITYRPYDYDYPYSFTFYGEGIKGVSLISSNKSQFKVGEKYRVLIDTNCKS